MGLIIAVLSMATGLSWAQAELKGNDAIQAYWGKVTQSERKAAAERIKAARAKVKSAKEASAKAAPQSVMKADQQGIQAAALAALAPTPGGVPDYFGSANWAFSPALRKFVDTLPGLGPTAANNLGQYIPVAVPDTTTYPGSDYYEIALVEYREQMHSDLPVVVGSKTTGDRWHQAARICAGSEWRGGGRTALSGTADPCHQGPAGAH